MYVPRVLSLQKYIAYDTAVFPRIAWLQCVQGIKKIKLVNACKRLSNQDDKLKRQRQTINEQV